MSFCTESFKKIAGLIKLASFYIQNSDLFTKSSDMLNKNTLGVKDMGPIRSSPTYVQPKALISAEAKISPITDVSKLMYNSL